MFYTEIKTLASHESGENKASLSIIKNPVFDD